MEDNKMQGKKIHRKLYGKLHGRLPGNGDRLYLRRLWSKIPADRVYLVLLLVFGMVCLTVTGGWRVYTDPLKNSGGKLLTSLGISREGWENPSGGHDQSASKGKDDGRPSVQNGGEGTLPFGEPDDPEASAEHSGAEESRGPEDGESPGREQEEGAEKPEGTEEQDEPDEELPRFHYQTVEDDYFADAVFIGDSRTVGMYEYGGLQDISTFYASTGLSVHKLFTAKIVEVPGQKKKITVEEALSERQFAKIYFMIGINEMGTGTAESFLEKYAESVARLRELQPDAIIYLQGIMQVTAERSAQGDYITNEGIDIRNEGIAALADDETIFYLDVNEAVCGEDGAMVSDYTHDGVHLKAQYLSLWKEYLKTHAVVFD